MISLKTYREYYEDVMRRVPGIHSVRVVNVDQDMSDCLKSISSDELPVLFVVVPSAQETGTDPDNVEEDNLDRMTTTPETGFYTDYSGWSVSFKLGTE